MRLSPLRFTQPCLTAFLVRPLNTYGTQERLHLTSLLLISRARAFDLLKSPYTPVANDFPVLRIVREEVTPG